PHDLPSFPTRRSSDLIVMLAAMLVGGFLPFVFVWFKAQRRRSAFETQLPDLLISLAASLKAGHSFKQGLQSLVDEDFDPASKERSEEHTSELQSRFDL